MLGILGLGSIDELEAILNKLIDVKIDITEDEINEFSGSFAANRDKLKNHPEKVDFEDIVRIYRNSLLKYGERDC